MLGFSKAMILSYSEQKNNCILTMMLILLCLLNLRFGWQCREDKALKET